MYARNYNTSLNLYYARIDPTNSKSLRESGSHFYHLYIWKNRHFQCFHCFRINIAYSKPELPSVGASDGESCGSALLSPHFCGASLGRRTKVGQRVILNENTRGNSDSKSNKALLTRRNRKRLRCSVVPFF